MAKIALELERALMQRAINGEPGRPTSRRLAQGTGWAVDDVLCTSGPNDRAFEEQHSWFSVAIVAAGSFQYRSGAAGEFMAPGMLLLGNAGQWFECGHEHGAGGPVCRVPVRARLFRATGSGRREMWREAGVPCPSAASAASYVAADSAGMRGFTC